MYLRVLDRWKNGMGRVSAPLLSIRTRLEQLIKNGMDETTTNTLSTSFHQGSKTPKF